MSARERDSGQSTLFAGPASVQDEVRLVSTQDWMPHERLSEEFAAMGFYLSGHPLNSYASALKRLGAVTYAGLLEDRRRSGFTATIGGTIIRKHERRGRNDQTYAFVTFSDSTGMFEVMFFPEALSAARALLETGKSVLVKASASWEGDELKLRAASVSDLDAAAANAGEGLLIQLENAELLGAIAAQLRQPGKGIVRLVVPGGAGEEVEIELPKRHQVTLALKNAIKSLPGVAMVESL